MQKSHLEQLEITLKQHRLSMTRARKEVFLLLLEATVPMTIQEIIQQLHSIHYVSIYRTVDALLTIGIIKQVPIGFKNKYEVSDTFKPHHHHVTCEKCGTSIAVHNDDIERLLHAVTINSGMVPTKHHFEAYGICIACK